MLLVTAMIQPNKLEEVKKALFKAEITKMTEPYMEKTIDAIVEAAHADTIGDGKIFVTELKECVRIRTGERGRKAIG